MSRYLDESAAAADGYRLVHEPAQQRFAIYFEDPGAESADAAPKLMGEAHYSLRGDDIVDFDHTLVSPELRGTGIAGLLAQHALTSDVVAERKIVASCWFIEGYLEKHPELLANHS